MFELAQGAIVIALLTIFLGALLKPLTERLSKRSEGWWRTAHHFRCSVVGSRDNRVSAIVGWPTAPAWLVRWTVFGSYKTNQQAWWRALQAVYDRHTDPKLRTKAETLLWVEKPIKDLRRGDITWENGHVLNIATLGPDHFEIAYSNGVTAKYYNPHKIFRVNQGWCSTDRCHFC